LVRPSEATTLAEWTEYEAIPSLAKLVDNRVITPDPNKTKDEIVTVMKETT
jgi:hypothetical protein